MSILQMSLSLPPSSMVLPGPNHLFLTKKLSHLSIHTNTTRKSTQIRMGGGPRTFPGGVSKWQWKRMQANKAKQLLKARLARERQIYEMRKRAELKAAVSELERPWEVVKEAPKLFSVGADEQVKVLADRFQKPGGFDMWSEKDGPQVFSPADGVPSARFFPKGVVHSIKPYGKIDKDLIDANNSYLPSPVSAPVNGTERNVSVLSGTVKGYNGNLRNKGKRIRSGDENPKDLNGLVLRGVDVDGEQKRENPPRHSGHNRFSRGRGLLKLRGPNSELFDKSIETGVPRKKGKRIGSGFEKPNNLNGFASGGVGIDGEQSRDAPARRAGNSRFNRGRGRQKMKGPNSEVFDMSLQHDGSDGFQAKK